VETDAQWLGRALARLHQQPLNDTACALLMDVPACTEACYRDFRIRGFDVAQAVLDGTAVLIQNAPIGSLTRTAAAPSNNTLLAAAVNMSTQDHSVRTAMAVGAHAASVHSTTVRDVAMAQLSLLLMKHYSPKASTAPAPAAGTRRDRE
jgi:hypothetical protein